MQKDPLTVLRNYFSKSVNWLLIKSTDIDKIMYHLDFFFYFKNLVSLVTQVFRYGRYGVALINRKCYHRCKSFVSAHQRNISSMKSRNDWYIFPLAFQYFLCQVRRRGMRNCIVYMQ